MKVALDATPLLDVTTGVARYTSELAAGLERRGIDLTRYVISARGKPAFDARTLRAPARLVQRSWQWLGRPRIERLVGQVDLVHATNFVLPSLGDLPGVVTVHDLSFERDDTFPGGERLRTLVPWSVRRAAKVLTPTETIAAELCDRYSLGRDRVAVTHEGVAATFFGATPLSDGALNELGLRRPFAVAVGTIEPRKNLPRLLQAWTSVRAELDGWVLALAGPKGWGPQLPPTPGVVPIGWVDDGTLPGLLAAAELFCYPSLYEGFGLPPLEAMAAGTPAVVGRYSAAAEVLGDAVRLVDPLDVEDIAAGILETASGRSSSGMVVRGRARATEFSWDRTAGATIEAYRSVL